MDLGGDDEIYQNLHDQQAPPGVLAQRRRSSGLKPGANVGQGMRRRRTRLLSGDGTASPPPQKPSRPPALTEAVKGAKSPSPEAEGGAAGDDANSEVQEGESPLLDLGSFGSEGQVSFTGVPDGALNTSSKTSDGGVEGPQPPKASKGRRGSSRRPSGRAPRSPQGKRLVGVAKGIGATARIQKLTTELKNRTFDELVDVECLSKLVRCFTKDKGKSLEDAERRQQELQQAHNEGRRLSRRRSSMSLASLGDTLNDAQSSVSPLVNLAMLGYGAHFRAAIPKPPPHELHRALKEDEFVDEVHKVLKSQDKDEIRLWFRRIDADGTGEVGWEEFSSFLLSHGQQNKQGDFRAAEYDRAAEPRQCPTYYQHEMSITAMAIHPKTGRVYTGSRDGSLRLWDDRLRHIKLLCDHGSWITDLQLNTSGTKLFMSTMDRALMVVEAKTGDIIRSYTGREVVMSKKGLEFAAETPPVIAVGRSNQEGYMAPKDVRAHNRAALRQKGMKDNKGAIQTMHFEEYRALMDIEREKHAERKNIEQCALVGMTDMPTAMAHREVQLTGSDGVKIAGLSIEETVVFGMNSGEMRIYRLPHAQARIIRELAVLKPHKKRINRLCMAESMGGFLSCSEDGSIKLTQWETLKVTRVFEAEKDTTRLVAGVHALAVAPKAKLFVSCNHERQAMVWDPLQDTPVYRLEEHNAPLLDCAINENDGHILTISIDNCIKVFDWRSYTLLQVIHERLRARDNTFTRIAFDPVRYRLLCGSTYPQAYQLTRKAAEFSAHYNGHTTSIFSALYNRNSSQPLLATFDGEFVNVWQPETGKLQFHFCLAAFSGSQGDFRLTCVNFDSLCRRVITGFHNGVVVLWNVFNGQVLSVVKDVESATEVLAVIAMTRKGQSFYVFTNGRQLIVAPELNGRDQFQITNVTRIDIPEECGTALCLEPVSEHLFAVGCSTGCVFLFHLVREEVDGKILRLEEIVEGGDLPASVSNANFLMSPKTKNLLGMPKSPRVPRLDFDTPTSGVSSPVMTSRSPSESSAPGGTSTSSVPKVERVFKLDRDMMLACHGDGRVVLWHTLRRCFMGSLQLALATNSIVSNIAVEDSKFDFLAHSDELGNVYVWELSFTPVQEEPSLGTSFGHLPLPGQGSSLPTVTPGSNELNTTFGGGMTMTNSSLFDTTYRPTSPRYTFGTSKVVHKWHGSSQNITVLSFVRLVTPTIAVGSTDASVKLFTLEGACVGHYGMGMYKLSDSSTWLQKEPQPCEQLSVRLSRGSDADDIIGTTIRGGRSKKRKNRGGGAGSRSNSEDSGTDISRPRNSTDRADLRASQREQSLPARSVSPSQNALLEHVTPVNLMGFAGSGGLDVNSPGSASAGGRPQSLQALLNRPLTSPSSDTPFGSAMIPSLMATQRPATHQGSRELAGKPPLSDPAVAKRGGRSPPQPPPQPEHDLALPIGLMEPGKSEVLFAVPAPKPALVQGVSVGCQPGCHSARRALRSREGIIKPPEIDPLANHGQHDSPMAYSHMASLAALPLTASTRRESAADALSVDSSDNDAPESAPQTGSAVMLPVVYQNSDFSETLARQRSDTKNPEDGKSPQSALSPITSSTRRGSASNSFLDAIMAVDKRNSVSPGPDGSLPDSPINADNKKKLDVSADSNQVTTLSDAPSPNALTAQPSLQQGSRPFSSSSDSGFVEGDDSLDVPGPTSPRRATVAPAGPSAFSPGPLGEENTDEEEEFGAAPAEDDPGVQLSVVIDSGTNAGMDGESSDDDIDVVSVDRLSDDAKSQLSSSPTASPGLRGLNNRRSSFTSTDADPELVHPLSQPVGNSVRERVKEESTGSELMSVGSLDGDDLVTKHRATMAENPPAQKSFIPKPPAPTSGSSSEAASLQHEPRRRSTVDSRQSDDEPSAVDVMSVPSLPSVPSSKSTPRGSLGVSVVAQTSGSKLGRQVSFHDTPTIHTPESEASSGLNKVASLGHISRDAVQLPPALTNQVKMESSTDGAESVTPLVAHSFANSSFTKIAGSMQVSVAMTDGTNQNNSSSSFSRQASGKRMSRTASLRAITAREPGMSDAEALAEEQLRERLITHLEVQEARLRNTRDTLVTEDASKAKKRVLLKRRAETNERGRVVVPGINTGAGARSPQRRPANGTASQHIALVAKKETQERIGGIQNWTGRVATLLETQPLDEIGPPKGSKAYAEELRRGFKRHNVFGKGQGRNVGISGTGARTARF